MCVCVYVRVRACACDSRLFPCSPVPRGGALHGLAAATPRSSRVAARFHDCGGSSQTTSDLCSPANHSLAPEGSGEGGEHNHFPASTLHMKTPGETETASSAELS